MCDYYLLTLARRSILLIIFILIENLQKLDISPTVVNWIINVLTDRTQQVVTNGRRSSRLSITRNIVQGSELDHYFF